MLDLRSALPINFEDDIGTLSQLILNPGLGSAIEVAKYLGMLQKLGFFQHGQERAFIDKVVVHPVFFTRPGGASLAKWGALSQVDIADKSAAFLSDTAFAGLTNQQGARSFDAGKLSELARKVVELQPTHGWPYRSLAAFAR